MNKKWTQVGAVFAALSVVLGALGAHSLKKVVSEPHLLASWDTAATYQMFHALGIVLLALIASGNVITKYLKIAYVFFVVGIVLFSGSIYSLVLMKSFYGLGLGPGALLTPVGGVCFILGWIFLILALKKK